MMEITLPFLTTANLLQASLPPPNHCEFINIWLKIWFVHNKISEMPDTISAKQSKILKQQLNLICKHHTPWQPIKSISMQVRFILNAMKDSCWSAIVLLGNWCSLFHSNRDIKKKASNETVKTYLSKSSSSPLRLLDLSAPGLSYSSNSSSTCRQENETN